MLRRDEGKEFSRFLIDSDDRIEAGRGALNTERNESYHHVKAYITVLDCESIGEKTEADERSTFDGDGFEIL